ncbi:MAG: T9SS type B sorting domain-containing protein, partial [Luteibaculaceae bacterium]
ENIVNVVLELPNIFTPNNDGVNDAFIPIEQENISIERVVIQNRWGQTVFEGREINWDGTINNQPATEGVYYYVVSYRNPKGEVKSKSGTVTLKR